MGSVSVSAWRCSLFVSAVHPVIVLSAVFCMVCSLFMLVSDVLGDHTVFAYSSVGSVIVLYVVSSVSFVFPQCAVVSAFSIFSVFLAFCSVFCVCLLKVSLGSNVRPSIFGFLFVGSVWPSICSDSVVLYSAGSGVKSVVVVLSAFSVSWFCFVHVLICSRYGCTFVCAVCGFVCVDSMVMSSA